MASTQPSRAAGSCWLALLLSVALHGSVGILLGLRPVPRDGAGNGGRMVVETCLLDSETATELVAPALVSQLQGPAGAAPPSTPEPDPRSILLAAGQPSPDVEATASVLPAAYWGPTPGNDGWAAPLGNGSSGTGTAGDGTVSFFEITAPGKAIVYVIDRSASMGLQGALETAKRELLASLERLPTSARFQVIVYNRQAEPLRIGGRSELLPACPENTRAVAALLRAVRAEGSTEHLRALQRALALQPDTIFFLTDAYDLQANQVRALTALNHGRCAIHTIELVMEPRSPEHTPLRVLAHNNRGVYRRIQHRNGG